MLLINKLIPVSCVDGPGNRMAIFLQGCNFNCTYCHNPETINVCSHCGRCVEYCPVNALNLVNGAVKWHPKACVQCDACIKHCPFDATPKAKRYELEEMKQIISKAAPFIDGITVSGGECLLQAEGLKTLFAWVKQNTALTCLIDTNGSISLELHDDLVNLADGFMLDVKVWNPKQHFEITGNDNRQVIANLELLLKLGKILEVRTVIAPGLPNQETIAELKRLIGGRCDYKLLGYHPYGVREKGLKLHGRQAIQISDTEAIQKGLL